MTRREYLERKLARRQEWAEGAKGRATQHFNAAHRIADNIPLGQPILVGHHSEKRARRDQSRIDGNMRKGVDEMHKAQHHAEKAEGLSHQLDKTIFSDDEDAIEALKTRIAANEAEVERYKAINAAWRKGGIEAIRALGYSEKTVSSVETTMRLCPYLKSPLDTTNLRARIRADKQRIEQLKQDAARTEEASKQGVLIEYQGEYVRVTFPEKPERDILSALKAAGFWWNRPSWNGKASNLPECISDMANRSEEVTK